MIVYNLRSGRREYPGYGEIEDRRRSRRADGTYMGYGRFLPPYDHYGSDHERMKEIEERETELEERERMLEERERRQEMIGEDRPMVRRMGYESYPIDYYGDDRYYGDGPQMSRGRGRGRGRYSY